MLKFVIFLSLLFVATVFCQTDLNEDGISPINNRISIPKTSGFPCPQGWMYFENQGICLFPTPMLSWKAVEEFCVKLGGHLMPIHGQYSFDNARQLLGNVFFWTGLNKDNSNDQWKHSNNETVNYLNFGITSNSGCLVGFSNQVHSNHGCDDTYYGICQVYASI